MGTLINTNQKYTIRYAAIHSFYWSVFCCSFSFASVFLLSKHFSNSQIGIVLAAANISAVFLQPSVAAFADTTSKISIKGLIALLIGMSGALAAARFLISDSFILLAVLYVLELSILCTLQPLLYSLGMQLINAGVAINFGLARGLGSLSYAIFSVLLGIIVEYLGTDSLTAFSVGLYIALGVVIYTFTAKQITCAADEACPPECAEAAGSRKSAGIVSFFAHNKKFVLLMAAVSFTFCSHIMINNYMIQIAENVGGSSKDMGIANGISAAIELPAMVLFGFLVKKIPCGSILKFSFLFFLIKAAITMQATNIWMLYAAQLLQFCSYALFIPASVFYVNQVVKKEDLAKGQAFITSANALGGVVASALGGWLLDHSGVGGMLFAGVIAAAVGAVIGFFVIEKVKTEGSVPAAEKRTDS